VNIIKPSAIIEDEINGDEILKKIEKAGRTCYKSEDKITVGSAKQFVKFIIEHGHESVLEHEKITVRVICDRGVSHEIVRHRIASYSQESTRFCNYSQDKFDGQLTFIKPPWVSVPPGVYTHDNMGLQKYSLSDNEWTYHCLYSEGTYRKLLYAGWSPQQARSILPNSLKTEIVMTMNLREWRHFFWLRTSSKAHPQIQEIARPLLDEFKERIPIIFDDISY
jgi:thymidylate synthase (FAD)